MLTKFARPAVTKWRNFALSKVYENPVQSVTLMFVRGSHYEFVPKTQYDMPIPTHMYKPKELCVQHWELTPILFIILGTVMWVMTFSIYSSKNKMDLLFERNAQFGYETYDLCHPTVHKMVTLNQCYDPWPEMAGILADMDDAEECLLAAMATGPCPPPKCP